MGLAVVPPVAGELPPVEVPPVAADEPPTADVGGGMVVGIPGGFITGGAEGPPGEVGVPPGCGSPGVLGPPVGGVDGASEPLAGSSG
jgi:hypothetical protein